MPGRLYIATSRRRRTTGLRLSVGPALGRILASSDDLRFAQRTAKKITIGADQEDNPNPWHSLRINVQVFSLSHSVLL